MSTTFSLRSGKDLVMPASPAAATSFIERRNRPMKMFLRQNKDQSASESSSVGGEWEERVPQQGGLLQRDVDGLVALRGGQLQLLVPRRIDRLFGDL
jgi:hypothetical protein